MLPPTSLPILFGTDGVLIVVIGVQDETRKDRLNKDLCRIALK
jgi:hypothetical protein